MVEPVTTPDPRDAARSVLALIQKNNPIPAGDEIVWLAPPAVGVRAQVPDVG